jgi:ABC-2 type transport system ATP-binding protein
MLPESVSPSDAVSTFGGLLEVEVRVSGRLVEASIDRPTAAVHRITGWALERGVELESLSVSRVSLEDVYLSLTDGAMDESR